MTTASSLVNDGNTANTQIIESTVSGDGSSCVTLTNDGILSNGNASHHGSFSSDNGLFKSDGSGNLAATSLVIGASQLARVTGNTLLNQSATNKLGSAPIGAFSSFNITSQAGSHAYNHGFSGTPAFIFLASSTEPPNYSIISWNSTTITINFTNAGQTYVGIALG